MRRVDRSAIAIPAALTAAESINHLNEIILDPTIKSKRALYRGRIIEPDGSMNDTVAIALKNLYKNKCAYCEKYSYNPHVEHFRPKKRVTGNQPLGTGYYWLCYEWTNLLPCCPDCNRIDAKGDKFPIGGIRKATYPRLGATNDIDVAQNLYLHAYLADEIPVYIHPEYGNQPENEFEFLRTGAIVGMTPNSTTMIRDLKLDSEDLNIWRREIYEMYFRRIETALHKFKRPNHPKSHAWFLDTILEIVTSLVEDSEDEAKEYTLFRKYIVDKIDYFFVQPLDPAFRVELRHAIIEALLSQ
jgi:uncharacterized protein (TIGR02646 family)